MQKKLLTRYLNKARGVEGGVYYIQKEAGKRGKGRERETEADVRGGGRNTHVLHVQWEQVHGTRTVFDVSHGQLFVSNFIFLSPALGHGGLQIHTS